MKLENFKLKRIDRYIIKQFLGTFAFTIVLMIAVTVVFDINEKIEHFLKPTVTVYEIAFHYYFNFIPYFIGLFSPLFTFIAVIFFTSKMASHTEIIAILSGGVSYRRFMRPYIIGSTMLALLSFFLINWVIPNSNAIRFEFDEKYYHSNPYQNRERNIHRQIHPNLYIYMQSYSTLSHIGNRFSLERFEDGLLKEKFVSDYIKWDTTLQKWSIMNYYYRQFDSTGERLTTGHRLDTLLPNFDKSDFSSRSEIVEAMNYGQLKKEIAKYKLSGSAAFVLFELERQKRFAYPFSSIILAVIGVCVSSQKKRGGIGINIGIGLALAFSYLLFQQVATVFSINAGFNPYLSVWIPNILYAFIAFFFYKKAAR